MTRNTYVTPLLTDGRAVVSVLEILRPIALLACAVSGPGYTGVFGKGSWPSRGRFDWFIGVSGNVVQPDRFNVPWDDLDFRGGGLSVRGASRHSARRRASRRTHSGAGIRGGRRGSCCALSWSPSWRRTAITTSTVRLLTPWTRSSVRTTRLPARSRGGISALLGDARRACRVIVPVLTAAVQASDAGTGTGKG